MGLIYPDTYIFGVIAGKGGVGKSTFSRLLAREFAANDWSVKIADMDNLQNTSLKWVSNRLNNQRQPEIAAEPFRTVDAAQKNAKNYNLMIFDASPTATQQTLQIAKISDLLILPTSYSIEDMEPAVTLAHSLKNHGIPKDRIVIAFSKVGDSEAEAREGMEYIAKSGYDHLTVSLPEQTGYRRALEIGHSPTETRFPSLNEKADLVVEQINQRFQKLQAQPKGEVKYG